MQTKTKHYYRILHYLKDVSVVLILFMLPFIYYFFRRSIAMMQDLSMVSQVWFAIITILLSVYLLAFGNLVRIEQHNARHSYELNLIKDTRYPSAALAGCILGTTIVNLLFYVVSNVFSFAAYQSLLVIYQYYPFFIIIHLELFAFMVFLLIRLTQAHQKQYMPLIGLFSKEIQSSHHIKKPII